MKHMMKIPDSGRLSLHLANGRITPNLEQQKGGKVEILYNDIFFKGTISLFCTSLELKMKNQTPVEIYHISKTDELHKI